MSKKPYRWTDGKLLEIYQWDQQRRQLGNLKSKAAEYGVTPKNMSSILVKARKRFAFQPTKN